MWIVFFLLPDLCDFEGCNLQISSEKINSGGERSLPPLVCGCSRLILLISYLDVLLVRHLIPQFLDLPGHVRSQRT